MSAVAVTDLSRRFGELVAVDGVSFAIERGEVFGLLGANGAGKTTIIRLLCCIYRPSAGRAVVLGLDTREHPELIRARVGYMSQRFSLYRELTVDENLRFYADVYRGGHDRRVLGEVCEQVGLSAVQRASRARTLPTGILQRAALAAAILHGPELLFLDEPTSGVDPRSRRVFWELIRRLAGGGTTVVVTTHAMTEAEGCTRVGMMSAGRMLAIGTPAELVARTGTKIVALDAEPWAEASRRVERRWPAAALYGRTVHIPTDRPEEVAHAARELLADLRLRSVAVREPTLEDAFVWHIGRAQGPRS